jgi:hypothetical protein
MVYISRNIGIPWLVQYEQFKPMFESDVIPQAIRT